MRIADSLRAVDQLVESTITDKQELLSIQTQLAILEYVPGSNVIPVPPETFSFEVIPGGSKGFVENAKTVFEWPTKPGIIKKIQLKTYVVTSCAIELQYPGVAGTVVTQIQLVNNTEVTLQNLNIPMQGGIWYTIKVVTGSSNNVGGALIISGEYT